MDRNKLRKEGIKLFENGQYDQAEHKFKQILAEDGEDKDALLWLGRCFFSRQDYKNAQPNYEKILNKKPKDRDALFFLGLCCLMDRNFEKAQRQYEILATDLDRDAACMLGHCLFARGKYSEAQKNYEKILVEFNDEVLYERIIPDHDGDTKLSRDLGQTCLKQQDYNDTQRQNELIFPNHGDDSDALFGLGLCFFMQKEYVKAQQEFDKILQQGNKAYFFISALYQSTACLRLLGKSVEARQLLKDNLQHIDGEHFKFAVQLIEKITTEIDASLPVLDQYEEKQADLWTLLKKVDAIAAALSPKQMLLFRGHGCKHWPLRSSLARQQPDDKERLKLANQYRTNFKLKAKYSGEKLDRKAPDAHWDAHMQHLGIATDFLDWSSDPQVALYFALSEGADFNQTPITDVCLWVAVVESRAIGQINDIKNDQSDDLNDDQNKDPAVRFYMHDADEKRIDAQQGYLSRAQQPAQCLAQALAQPQVKEAAGVTLYCLSLENDLLGEQNKQAKQTLQRLGMSPLKIYPDIVGLKQEIMGHSKPCHQHALLGEPSDWLRALNIASSELTERFKL